MWVDGDGLEQPSRAVHDGRLHAGADAGIEPQRHPLTGGRSEQQVVQVAPEDGNRLRFRLLAEPLLDVGLDVHRQLVPPRPPHRLEQPRVRRTTFLLDPRPRSDAPVGVSGRVSARRLRQDDCEAEHVLLASAEQCERPMRRHVPHRLARREVVGELGAGVFLARHHGRCPLTALPEQASQPAHQLRVFGKHLDENPARPLERRVGIFDAFGGVDER